MADSGRPCVSYSVFRKAPPYYTQAERLAHTTPQPWLRWHYSPAEWEAFNQQKQADLAEGGRQATLVTAVFAAALIGAGLGWHKMDNYAATGPAILVMWGIAFFFVVLVLVINYFVEKARYKERESGSYLVIISPLELQQGQVTVRLFDEYTFCTRIRLDQRRTPARLNFRVCKVGRGSYTTLPVTVPIPPGQEAEARALVARFQHEIFDALDSDPVPTPPAPSSGIAPPRRAKPRPPPRHHRR
ncbi:MAG: hypothetical protein M3Z04_06760 [Chloroflexota bacterium]|nr:hypothetical protein [Chloroflexota bacterium]